MPIGRPRKPAPPALPRVVLERQRVPGVANHDGFEVTARDERGGFVKRWEWWSAEKPRHLRRAFITIAGTRYAIADGIAKTNGEGDRG